MFVEGRSSAQGPATTDFVWDLRFGGYYASNSSRSAWGGLAGVQFGAIHWFDKSTVGLVFMAGPQAGYLSTDLGVLAITGDAGFVFAPGKSRTSGTRIALAWAPKLFGDFSFSQFGKGEVASPVGLEAVFDLSGFEIPIWFLQTLDGTSFVGASLGGAFW